jgi:hypothetical protein
MVTTTTSDALLPHLGDHEAERRLLSLPDLGTTASSLRRILDADLGGGRMIFFLKIDFSYRSVPTDTINGLFLYRTNGIGSSNQYHKHVTDRYYKCFL